MGGVEAETRGDLLVGRIPQNAAAGTDLDGHIGRGHLKSIEQFLRLGVTVEVDVLMRMSVQREKLFHPQRSRTVQRADHDNVPNAPCDEFAPAEDERPHQDLAQVGVSLYEGEELLAIEFDHLTRLADAKARQRPATSDHVALARELPGSVSRDHGFRLTPWGQDLNLAAHESEERHGTVPSLDEHVTLHDRTPAPARGDPADLRSGERGERGARRSTAR